MSLLVLAAPLARGQTPEQIQADILAGQSALYQGRFVEAIQQFTTLTKNFPTDPKGYFFLALTYRWLTRIDPEAEEAQQDFEQAAKQSIAIAQRLVDKDPKNLEALLYLAATYGYRAEYYNFLQNRWDKAYDDGVKMWETLKQAQALDLEGNVDVQLGYGLYYYYADFYRKKIGWWQFLAALPKGDRAKGIALVKMVREQGIYLNVEAWYFLADIYKRDNEFKGQAAPLAASLYQAYPGNPYFHIFLAGIYHATHDWANAIRTAQDILSQAGTAEYYSQYIVYQAKYLIGESEYFLGRYQEALRQFDEIITARPATPAYLLPWSHLRRGAIYDVTGEKEKAAADYHAVLKLDDVLRVHQLAEELLKNQKNNP